MANCSQCKWILCLHRDGGDTGGNCNSFEPRQLDLVPTMKLRWKISGGGANSANPILQQWFDDRSVMAKEGSPAAGQWVNVIVEVE